MNKLYSRFAFLKLKQKFSVLIITVVVLPLILFSVLFFNNIQELKIKEKMKSIEVNFAQNYSQIQTKVEVCFLSTQVVINSEKFWDNIINFSTNDPHVKDLREFYSVEIKGIEKLVNSNPYLYQIRVYLNTDKIPEMMPVLYHSNRMDRLSWGISDEFPSRSWIFDYSDSIFPANRKPTEHLASYVTNMKVNSEINAIIEVSTRMELLFPDLYTSNEDEWTYFVDKNENFYYNTDYESRWEKNIHNIYERIPKNLESNYSYRDSIEEVPVIISSMPLKELDGYLIKIVSIEEDVKEVMQSRNIFWVGFLCIMFLLILLTNKSVEFILKHFYVIMQTIRQVQKGNLAVRVPQYHGKDEMGELGLQVNEMLNQITWLMDDSIKREVLVKDSEIRALQNQINAHFIYNVLESIKMMAEMKEEYSISDAVTALGKLLRYSMKWVSKNVTVIEEIDYIKNYLSLINLRFDYEIFLSLNIPEKIYHQEIPKMSLQPIIENAIYHGIEDIAEDTSIYMKGSLFDGFCTIEITDSGRGMTEENVRKLQQKINGEIETKCYSGNGIGLKNVQDRIKISFGDNYGISIASKKGCYTKVIVKIPLL